MTEQHKLMRGKVNLYRRPNGSNWQCSTYLAGRNWRTSTKEDSLARAKDFAEDWYLELRGKDRAGLVKHGKTFRVAADQFLKEYQVITHGHRGPEWVERLEGVLRKYLVPYFGAMVLSEITPGKVQEYRIHRAQNGYRGISPSRSTISSEMVALRQVIRAIEC